MAIVFLACGCGSGWLPLAPGTWGSLLGLTAAWAAADCSAPIRFLLASTAFGIGVPLCGRAARCLGTGPDPAVVVFDEIVGVLWTLVWFPRDGLTWILGFALFRLWDIAKPGPIRRCERLPGGLGIMADDLAAALGAAGSLALVRWLLFPFAVDVQSLIR